MAIHSHISFARYIRSKQLELKFTMFQAQLHDKIPMFYELEFDVQQSIKFSCATKFSLKITIDTQVMNC